MYLFDEVSRKLTNIKAEVEKDEGKLFGHEWRDWRVYDFISKWLSGVLKLREEDEKTQLLYLFRMEYLFFHLLEQWSEYFSYEYDSVLPKQHLMNAIETLEPLRKKLSISIKGNPQLQAEYYCETCNSFYYHKSAFQVHCIKCEGMLNFLGIIPVKEIYKGFMSKRLQRYYGEVISSVKNLDI